MAVRYIDETEAWSTEVTDAEILDAQMELTKDAGIFVEPAAACAWAGLIKDRNKLQQEFGKDVSVCVLLTGTGFKDMAVFDGRVTLPDSIENSAEAVVKRFS
jgi:threonine synthase